MLKQKLASDGRAFGAAVFEFFTPGIAQIAKASGAEFVLYDIRAPASRRSSNSARTAAGSTSRRSCACLRPNTTSSRTCSTRARTA